jgi:hypothetical protein
MSSDITRQERRQASDVQMAKRDVGLKLELKERTQGVVVAGVLREQPGFTGPEVTSLVLIRENTVDRRAESSCNLVNEMAMRQIAQDGGELNEVGEHSIGRDVRKRDGENAMLIKGSGYDPTGSQPEG